jgi:hypothetical protein
MLGDQIDPFASSASAKRTACRDVRETAWLLRVGTEKVSEVRREMALVEATAI